MTPLSTPCRARGIGNRGRVEEAGKNYRRRPSGDRGLVLERVVRGGGRLPRRPDPGAGRLGKREPPVRRVIVARLPSGARSEVDNLGNLTLELGSGRPLRLVLASMDEPGYVVTRIQEDGYLRGRRLARLSLPALFDQYFVGQPLSIAADDSGGTLPVVFAVPP